MCGICGIYNLTGQPVDQALLGAMTDIMRHRGPDGRGIYVQGAVGLGHRRLSIIDLDGGAQPLGNEDGSIQVVFNGEIYNFVELRERLENSGHAFRTRSDTEVIVHAYEQWGHACVKKFNGMFAFALWDSRRRQLFIARDHLGIKPLYYFHNGHSLVFASEIKSLLQHGDCPRAVDEDSLAALFTFRYVPSPNTLFKGIRKLPPGHLLMVDSRGVRTERYWTVIPRAEANRSEESLIEEYQYLVEDAVRLQLRSDVPLGLFLSSGVDSGTLLAIMSDHASRPVQTYTIGFQEGSRTNEVDEAKAMARMFGADHDFQVLGPADYVRYYERYMWDLEEPVGNETAAAFYFVSRITSREVKVALCGQGPDELWAGYDRHRGARLSSIYSRTPRIASGGIQAVVKRLPGRMERLKRGADSLAEPDMLTRFAKVYSFFSADMKAQLYKGALKADFERDRYGTRKALGRLQTDVRHLDPLTQMLYIDARSNLPDDLLMVGDKTSMACSLETRVPYLDHRLVEFAERLPGSLRLNGLTGKYLHKKSALKWLPRDIVYRKKKGFANPIEQWFRVGMKSYVEDCLLSPDAGIARYFDQEYIRRILRMDQTGRAQYRRQIYLLLSLELWHRTFMDPGTPGPRRAPSS